MNDKRQGDGDGSLDIVDARFPKLTVFPGYVYLEQMARREPGKMSLCAK